MTGFVGGHLESTSLESCAAELYREDWYEQASFHTGDLGLTALHHGEKDPNGFTSWKDGSRSGAIYGVVTNLDELGLDVGSLFERVLDEPQALLPELDGTFLITAMDDDTDRVVIASDKLGTRQCFYIDGEPFAFGTEVGALTMLLDDPQVDERAISDLLMIGHVWGEKTLVQGINFLPSGSILQYEAGDGCEIESYWHHSFVQSPDDSYLDDLTEAYQSVIADMAATIDGDIGLWLSGGLDSRSMAGELSRYHDITTYTYDSNPANGSNLELAGRISDILGLENKRVKIESDRFVDSFEKSVQLTSGMVGLSTFTNLSTVFNIPDMPDIIIEGCGQGGMMGDGIGQAAIEQSSSPEAALYRAKHRVDVDDARRLLRTDFDPMTTYREEVRKSDQPDLFSTALDCYYRNYFPRCDFASNPIAESQAGTRVPFSDTQFLQAVTRMPLSHRVASIPFTNGKIPAGTAYPKVELVRRLDERLASIPYERTKVPPSRPMWQHAVGFVVGTSVDRLRGLIDSDIHTYGGRSMVGTWYRENRDVRERIDDLLASACDRPYFDAEEIHRLQREEMTGEAEHMSTISGIITGELWVRKYIDREGVDERDGESSVRAAENTAQTV
ncbi:asparagine synthase [Haloferax sp. MBLA0076]|uniref:Asparagine synthase n=1 Tax=Haloferax litoreum TaxID=2666140 RepID=A0A6A8GNZ4_9EURY|nr:MULTISPECIES: asparagine synthase-related protein [Haloferax]KAB1189949.1 asparagine synthase [Haloferax sp. CBA1148]MRX23720.1 asparagine synthase [Haloferax litoreum]